MSDCVFCKIINNQIPSKKIYEDDSFLAFLDISPVSLGHTLLVPKTHYRWVYDVPEFSEYWNIAKRIAIAIKSSSLNPEFISFLTMGNEVHHAHIHIIPRSVGDSVNPHLASIPHLVPTEEQLQEISENIKNLLK